LLACRPVLPLDPPGWGTQFALVSSGSGNVLNAANWRSVLAEVCREERKEDVPVIVCLAGPPSAGKSTLGAEIRNKGLPGIPKRRVAVIDDCVMSVSFLGIPLGRVRDRTKKRGLTPFLPWLRGKRVVVFIGIRPWERIDRCDILVRVHCSGTERERRQAVRGKTFSDKVTPPPAGWLSSARLLEVETG